MPGAPEIMGEVVNTGDKPVVINGLMAAIFDPEGAPIAIDNAAIATRYLAPGEYGPCG